MSFSSIGSVKIPKKKKIKNSNLQFLLEMMTFSYYPLSLHQNYKMH